MPLALLIVILDITLVVHAVRSGQGGSPWAFIILMVPVIGAVAYIWVAVIVPDWFGSPQGQQTQRRIANSLNPEKRYRELSRRGGDRRHDRKSRGARRGMPRAGKVRGGEARTST